MENIIVEFCNTKNVSLLEQLPNNILNFMLVFANYSINKRKGNINIALLIRDALNILKSIPIDQIYLSNEQRSTLIKQIKANMIGVIKENGKQCVNGSNTELLKYLELTKILGRGSFGNVYAGCSPKPCNQDAYNFAVKLAFMKNSDFNSYYSRNKQPWHEVYILDKMIKPLIENGISPNLPLLIKSYTCSNCELEFYNRTKLVKKNSPCLILLLELATGGDMKNWFKNKPSKVEIYSALFQIMAGVHTIQAHGQILNNDIKSLNILIYDVKPGGYWCYIIHGNRFYVPNYGKLFILNDFGISIVYSPNHKLTRKVKELSNLGGRYAMIINNEYSPLNSKKQDSKEIKWGYWTKKGFINTMTSKGSIAKIYLDSNKIVDPEIEFTNEQITHLNRLGIPADSSRKEFYEHPEIIPPNEFVSDTQDVIKMFIGNQKRATQQGYHPNYNIDKDILDQLKEYLIIYYNIFDYKKNNSPKNGIAGYFILDFFIKHKDYRFLPNNEKIIATYPIS